MILLYSGWAGLRGWPCAGKDYMITLIDKIIAKYIMDEKPQPYSSRIDQAFRVVEKFRRGCMGHAAAVIEMVVSDVVTYPDCECKIYGPDTEDCFGFGGEMPKAICRATVIFIKKYKAQGV